MKLLLDENLPVRLKYRFSSGVTVSTVSDEGWNAKKDGKLLELMEAKGFTILVTSDKSLRYQQNLKKHKVVAIVLLSPDNRYHTLKEDAGLIEKELPPNVSSDVIEISLEK